MDVNDAHKLGGLQAAIDASLDNGLPVYLSRDVEVSETVVLPNVNGIKIIGTGSYGSGHMDHPFTGPRSAIIWTGEPGGTVLEVGSANTAIYDVALHAKHRRSPIEDAAGVGVVLTNVSGDGVGTGGLSWHNFTADGFREAAIQIGTDRSTTNCDTSTFTGRTLFVSCRRGMHCLNDMGMGFHFDHIYSRMTRDTFRFEAGGGLSVGNVTVTRPRNLNNHGYDPAALLSLGSVKSNSGDFLFSQVKLDAEAQGCKLLACDQPGQSRTKFGTVRGSWNKHTGSIFSPLDLMPGHAVSIDQYNTRSDA
jgi:hypothetical protein